MWPADQVADQIEVALHLGRDRQDAHLLLRGRSLRGSPGRKSARPRRAGRAARRVRPAKARHRLRAAKIGSDEVAFEMRGNTALPGTASRAPPRCRRADAGQRRAGDGRRAESGDAVTRRRAASPRRRRGSECRSLDAVDVHVDEARNEHLSGHVGRAAGSPDAPGRTSTIARSPGRAIRAQDRIFQHDAAAGKIVVIASTHPWIGHELLTPQGQRPVVAGAKHCDPLSSVRVSNARSARRAR